MNDEPMRNGECGMGNVSVGNARSLPAAAGGVPALPHEDDRGTRSDNGNSSPFGRRQGEGAVLNPEPSLPAVAGNLNPPPDDPRIAAALTQYAAALDSGRPLRRDDFLARHADIAQPLAECLEALEFIHGAAAQVHGDNADSVESFAGMPAPLALGDFRIIRELGRGGMGVVYEAQQLSLARRVALKVLPFASMLDPRHLARFRNEALAAASLKHPNIVSVYCVGCERGVHFYAMEYVEGQTLAAVIDGLKDEVQSTKDKARTPLPPREGRERANGNDIASVGIALSGVPKGPDDAESTTHSAFPIRHSPFANDTVAAALSTLRTDNPRDFFRLVAELGIQAAEALDHAHQMGIVHRDIKPSNLMIECSHLAPRDGTNPSPSGRAG